jgi:hypothetical protein
MTELKMATLFAFRRSISHLDADGVAPWLDQFGLPLVLGGAVLLMVATIAA